MAYFRFRYPLAASLLLWGCADGSELEGGGGGQGGQGQGGARPTSAATTTNASQSASTGVGGSGGAPGVDRMCAPDTFVTSLNSDGSLNCEGIDTLTRDAINTSCSITTGWRDSCNGCALAPTKWGKVSGTTCTNGVGTHNTCTTISLGGTTVELFGLNADGDVNNDDKFYVGFHCAAVSPGPSSGPCPAGSLAVGLSGQALSCEKAASAVADYVGNQCSLFFGWRDGCDGCTLSPIKWGSANDASCVNGLGAGNTCTTETLGGESIRLFGLDTDGDVDGNDVFYSALRCAGAQDATGPSNGTCPSGQFMVGIYADGSLACRGLDVLVESYFKSSCSAWFGWRDGCDGCGLAPSKWGRVKDGFCTNGLGAQNTCTTPNLGGSTVSLFGLNLDGEVDGNDTFFSAFRCE